MDDVFTPELLVRIIIFFTIDINLHYLKEGENEEFRKRESKIKKCNEYC